MGKYGRGIVIGFGNVDIFHRLIKCQYTAVMNYINYRQLRLGNVFLMTRRIAILIAFSGKHPKQNRIITDVFKNLKDDSGHTVYSSIRLLSND